MRATCGILSKAGHKWIPDRIAGGTLTARTNMAVPAPNPDFVNGFALQFPEQYSEDFDIQMYQNVAGNIVFASFKNVSVSRAPIVPLWKFLYNPNTPDFPFAWSWEELTQEPRMVRVGPWSYSNRFFTRRPWFQVLSGLPVGEHNWYHSEANVDRSRETVQRWSDGRRSNAAHPRHRTMPDLLVHYLIVWFGPVVRAIGDAAQIRFLSPAPLSIR